MAAETTPPTASRGARRSLLVLLGVVVAGFALMTLRNSADPVGQTANPVRPAQQTAAAQKEKLNPEELDVRLEALKQTTPPQPDETGRNPFRFKPKPPPPLPPPPKTTKSVTPGPPPPPPPPTVPPIPLKFIGVTEAPAVGKIAALTDCRHTVQGVEGEVIDGQYRIVKIGIESLVIEYLDGKARTTLRMTGAECVAK